MTNSIVCFLGAGFSYVAGVPLARDLFKPYWPIAMSERSRRHFLIVHEHYENWQKEHPGEFPEQYMGLVYTQSAGLNAPKWEWVVEYVCAVIASVGTPPPSLNRNPRYSNRVNRPFYCAVHQTFWDALFRVTRDISVITSNYDILVERVLRHRLMRRPPSPGCFYGGLPKPQILKGSAQPFSLRTPERIIEMTGTIPVFKLHGSLNWTLNDQSIVAFQDMRPVFRHGGTAAIIPPVPEKPVPEWLHKVWDEAESSLRRSNTWVICGYSMPDYDKKVWELLQTAGSGRPLTIFLLSPEASVLQKKYSGILPEASVICLPGLPEGISQLSAALDRMALTR
jgi:SIR2-like domain